MKIENVPFCTIDWNNIPIEEHPGIKGKALWKTFEMGNIRVRMVEYTPGYIADHWCHRGHVLLVLEGELITDLDDGRKFVLTPGTSYQVAEDANPHRSITEMVLNYLLLISRMQINYLLLLLPRKRESRMV